MFQPEYHPNYLYYCFACHFEFRTQQAEKAVRRQLTCKSINKEPGPKWRARALRTVGAVIELTCAPDQDGSQLSHIIHPRVKVAPILHLDGDRINNEIKTLALHIHARDNCS